MRKLLARHSPLLILAALSLVISMVSPDFRQLGNLQSVLMRTCVIGIMAIGQTLVIIAGGIDLSVGQVAALGGVVSARLAQPEIGWPVAAAVVAGTGTGAVCGLISGLLVARAKVPPFIATLGMMMAARGFVFLISEGQTVSGMPRAFNVLGGSVRVWGLAGWWIPVLATAVLCIIFTTLLTLTPLGRRIFATGGNPVGARMSGIPVDRVRIIVFTLCGLTAGFAGCVLASRTGVGDPSSGQGRELDAIAACVIGGASLMGGEGTVIGAAAGALIMEVLVNICNLMDVKNYWQDVMVGTIVVALVSYDVWRRRRSGLLRE